MDFDTREIRKMEIKEKPQKSNRYSKGLTIVIVLLSLINIGLVSYIVYDNKLYKPIENFLKKEKKPVTKKTSSKTLSLTDENVATLYSYLSPLKEKFVMNSSVTPNELTEEEKKIFGLSLLREEDFEKEDNEEETYQLKSIALEDAVHRLLGPSFDATKEDIKTPSYQNYSSKFQGNFILDYEETCNCYHVTIEEKEEPTIVPFYTKLEKAIEKEDKILLYEKVVYTLEEEGKVSLYSNWQLTDLLTEKSKEEWENSQTLTDAYFGEGTTVVYTFQKQKKNYQFASSKIK